MNITLYTRAGCHLCDEAKKVLKEAQAETAFDLEEVDIDQHPNLKAEFNEQVPVVFINGRKAFKYRVDPCELRRRLSRANTG